MDEADLDLTELPFGSNLTFMEDRKFDRGPQIQLREPAEGPEPLYVTRPFLPPLNEYTKILQGIWNRGILTNNGPLNYALEEKLEQFLGAPSVATISNGSLALEMVLEAAQLTGEVITTPYSFVATSHSILRAGLTPVFVDIEDNGFNLNPARVEEAITDRTSAILAVHCYGIPCDVDALANIARRHKLTLIYDAAHAFGVRLEGRSLFSFGDYSTLSFHATKVFHTFEGGAITVSDPAKRDRINSLRNFGITSETTIPYIGTNAKLSEPSAAMGLLQLDYIDFVLSERARVDRLYREGLADIKGIYVPPIPDGVISNHSYFPILVTSDFPLSRDGLYEHLKSERIFTRRYFYPLLSSLPMYESLPSADPKRLHNASRASEQILCLPIYPLLSDSELQRVVCAIRRSSSHP
ncbi:DegT/DnrJ/EryC1/StrS aminotransferase family protein [Croceicoccus sp. Ery15]|uniref:DegT/DnrJ/EryC1/StrS family aminotransferase n=1 Tax=Croceicoccus sp. Ery15 TaxID=1703338 RepID=UPI001E388C30|nr:DegT/DnrJ/EryC1/StrS family aminotransferase [Croceicoccus sp. Ery15]